MSGIDSITNSGAEFGVQVGDATQYFTANANGILTPMTPATGTTLQTVKPDGLNIVSVGEGTGIKFFDVVAGKDGTAPTLSEISKEKVIEFKAKEIGLDSSSSFSDLGKVAQFSAELKKMGIDPADPAVKSFLDNAKLAQDIKLGDEKITDMQWNRWGTLAKEIGGAALAGVQSWLQWKALDVQETKIENDFAVQKLVVALQETVAEKEANYKIEALENTKDLAEINSNTEVAKKRLDNADRKDERHSRTLKELFSSRKTPLYGNANV